MEVKDWLGPTVALVGVVVASFLAESYRRFKSGSVLAAGISGELKSYKPAFPILLERMSQISSSNTCDEAPRLFFRGKYEIPKDKVYEANVANLGLLGSELASKTAYLYGQIVVFRIALKILGDHYEEMEATERCERAKYISTTLKEIGECYQEAMPLLEARSTAGWRTWLKRSLF